ncbi:MAG: DUF58 domain-containing protein [Bryobacter sp.]|nr:DUF58 domain-containing protein [Bryobacter sp.]
MAKQEFKIERSFLERLERLTIHWQKSFPGVVGGHNPSRYTGPGQEFLDHRNYAHGDDLRAVNWRAFMRLEKLFLKLFQIEPRVPIRLLMDASGSMGLGDKWDFARRLVAALVYVGLVRLDAIQILPFRDGLEEGLQCGGGRHRFSPVAQFLGGVEAQGPTDFAKVAREFLDGGRARGLLIVVSDFLGEQDYAKPLQYLADYGHDLFLVQVWDEQERAPRVEGDLEIEQVESGERLQITFDAGARERYIAAFDEHAESIRRVAIRNRGRYAAMPTNVNLEEAVFAALTNTLTTNLAAGAR